MRRVLEVACPKKNCKTPSFAIRLAHSCARPVPWRGLFRTDRRRAPTAGRERLKAAVELMSHGKPSGDALVQQPAVLTCVRTRPRMPRNSLSSQRISGRGAVFLSGLASSSKRPPPVADNTDANQDGVRAHGFGGMQSAISKAAANYVPAVERATAEACPGQDPV